jgi:hypothetical protein
MQPMAIEGEPNRPWTDAEVERTVAAYFEMWRGYVVQGGVSKAERVRVLNLELPARNRAAIEYKFRNISSVLQERRDEWLAGYAPLPNIQGSLRGAVEAYLADHIDVAALIQAHSENVIPGPTNAETTTEDVLVAAPTGKGRSAGGGITGGRIGAIADFQRRELGKAGESWVIDRERASLRRAGRQDLAEKVIWVARDVGDGLGYDIESFSANGMPLRIEVKTTNRGISTPFYITRNEVNVSKERADEYSLYRVFDFRTRPRLYRLDGSVEETARLEPWVFVGEPAGLVDTL